MASTACFVIVSRNDIPIYEAELGSAFKLKCALNERQQFATLPLVTSLLWLLIAATRSMFHAYPTTIICYYWELKKPLTEVKEEAARQHQFILHAALDIVQDLAWTTSAMFLKTMDRFNDLVVSVYVTAGHTRLMLLHDSRNEDGIKSFFQEIHELYIKILLNPLYLPESRVTSSHFDTKVRALARRYL